MNTYKQDTHLSILLWTRGNAGACLMLAVLALALLCSAPSTAQCVVGTNAALSFDGINHRAVVQDNSALDGLSDFTIECWIRPSISPTGTDYFLAKTNTFSFLGWGLGLNSSTSMYLFLGTPSSFISTNMTLSQPLSIANWNHVAVVRSGSSISTFVGGMQSAALTFGGTTGDTPASVTIGSASLAAGGTTQHFQGNLDEVRIWNVARTQAQIQSTMNIGLVGTEPGLVGYWRFDEGSGQTVFNSAVATGSALDGTLGANALPGTDDPAWLPSSAPLLYCPGCGPGSSNSAAASLQINGLGAVGVPGPFAITGASGSTLNLLWNGPPNQPLILAAGPPSAGCGVLSGFGTIDIGTPPSYFDVVFAFNGLVPPTSYFFVTNPAGLSVQTFLLPVLPGASLAVQGLVFQPPGVAAFGVLPTASFSIQF